jgi:hypothetical protein
VDSGGFRWIPVASRERGTILQLRLRFSKKRQKTAKNTQNRRICPKKVGNSKKHPNLAKHAQNQASMSQTPEFDRKCGNHRCVAQKHLKVSGFDKNEEKQEQKAQKDEHLPKTARSAQRRVNRQQKCQKWGNAIRKKWQRAKIHEICKNCVS